MGTFRIEIQATGGHGCQREIKDGGVVEGCKQPTCLDCLTREFVQKLKSNGVWFDLSTTLIDTGEKIAYARLTHWPETSSSVVDDLLTGIRKGSF